MNKTENSNLASKLILPESLEEIDKCLATAKLDKPFEVAIDPAKLLESESVPLLESSIIQWISTLWCSAPNDAFEIGRLDNEEQLKYLATSAPGAVLALLPPGKIKGIDRRSTATFKKQFFASQKGWPDLAVTSSALLLCLDSYSKDGLPHQLYLDQSSGDVTDWDGFRLFVDKLILSVVEEAKFRGEIQRRANNISTILFELFKNTHDHARVDVDGSVISDSVRGIYSHFYPINVVAERPKLSPEKTDALDNYLNIMMKPKFEKRHSVAEKRDLTGFLELSVFDTGPGMAARWLGSDIANFEAKEQYDAVMHCLSKGNTTSATRGRGFGLWRVMQELAQLKGFIRIRTNKVHVFRQYAMLDKLHMVHHADGQVTPQEIFFDWRKQFTSTLSEYPPVKGTVVSIILPVGVL